MDGARGKAGRCAAESREPPNGRAARMNWPLFPYILVGVALLVCFGLNVMGGIAEHASGLVAK